MTVQETKINISKHAQPESVRDTLLGLLEAITKVDFRKEAKIVSNEELSQKHYLITTIEQLLLEANKKNWGLCINQDKLYVYNGTYWQNVDKEDLQFFLGSAARKMGVDKFNAKFYLFRDKLMKQFAATAHLPTPEKAKNVTLINLSNGTFEITPNKKGLRDYNSNDFLKYKLPFKFDEKATCPKFIEYLNRVLPDNKMQQILAEFIGYVFTNTSTLKLEKTLLLIGIGANGKSVFFDIINALLGKSNVSNFTLESLTDNNGYYRASISDKLLNYSSEISNRLNIDLFKQMVSGEPVEARQIYHKPQVIEDYAKLMFNCNELPTPRQHKDAYFRRFIIIPFDVKIPVKDQNPNLAQEIIKDELPGIFNWVLEGLDRLLKNEGFTDSEAVNSALNKYRSESDSVKLFIKENRLKPGVEKKVPLKDMYNSYKEFCKDEELKAIGKTNFSNTLRDSNYHIDRDNIGMVVHTSK